jgi:squalene-hopene/tetraprenyl-beta-curcumene cyclase
VSSVKQIDPQRLQRALERATTALLEARSPEGHWTGELSSSALSTATAVTALTIAARESEIRNPKAEIERGLDWLARHANADGGWGDTTISLSNLSTTALCWAAFGAVSGADETHRTCVQRAETWLKQHAGGLDPATLAPAIIRRYGKDRTFSVPILTMCALAGRLGEGREAWRHVLPLPFELAACPRQWFAALRLPVVSYALPALIAIGQARHHHRPTRNPFTLALRHAARARTLRVLTEIQPSNGGFLEATPLTSFVVMSLAGSGQAGHAVTKRGVEFLLKSQRIDGSWPIDTNLATWLTTLAVNASADFQSPISDTSEVALSTKSAIADGQYCAEHPYTHAAPGGWAWTNLPGGVPDADDTAGAVLALRKLGSIDGETRTAAIEGLEWLLNVQNKDGGIPTFCRGWGALPFDRSSADITAHAVRAWAAWRSELVGPLRVRTDRALRRAVDFLVFRAQRPNGSWVPLWFGNQNSTDDENPTYGTARVLPALVRGATLDGHPFATRLAALSKGSAWLTEIQREDGSWGGGGSGPSSVEETALAVEALACVLSLPAPLPSSRPEISSAVDRGVNWLIDRVESGTWTEPAPIGFYFAKLWYFERLYPLIFTVGALRKVQVGSMSRA